MRCRLNMPAGPTPISTTSACRRSMRRKAKGLVDAVDGFCEGIAFSPEQMARVFDRAAALGLPVKLHAEQLSHLGGTRLAARYGALSADHLEHADAGDAEAMAAAGTVAVLLPGAFYTLRDTNVPPIEAFRAAGVPMAVATDCNPGSSPLTSILTAMNMACTLFRLTPMEALAGTTVHAARALGLADRGAIAVGLRADLAVWDVGDAAELAYRIGFNPLHARIFGGDFGSAARAMSGPMILHPGETGLAQLEAIWRGEGPVELHREREGRRRGRPCARRAGRSRRRGGLWREHRLRQARLGEDRGRRHRHPAAQSRPVALLRRRRCARRTDRAADDGAQAPLARARRIGRGLGDDRAPGGDDRARRDARRARARLGRRVGRSRAARAYGRRHDRRRRGLCRRRAPARPPRRWRVRGSRPSSSARRKGSPFSTARSSRPPSRSARSSRRGAARPRAS